MKKILITGCCGFIGFHLTRFFLEKGFAIYGIDNINNYYDIKLKKDRLKILKKFKNFFFKKIDINNTLQLNKEFTKKKIEYIVHLAAQAGVRYSLKNPLIYTKNNIHGFVNIIELAKKKNVKKFLYASSSSVYGQNKKYPFSETDSVDHPISIYAATKRSNELIAHTYSHLFKLNTIGLRFFTVYGPYGRPDMSLFKFTNNILKKKPIVLYNNGEMYRDFTYVDDLIYSLEKILFSKKINLKKKTNFNKNFLILNLGNKNTISLKKYVQLIEKACKKKAIIKYKRMQPGDVPKTISDNKFLKKIIKKTKVTNHQKGIKNFVNWFISYYKLKK